MVGYPKSLKTKEDYEYVRNNFPKEMWKKDFQALLDSSYDWFFVEKLLKKLYFYLAAPAMICSIVALVISI